MAEGNIRIELPIEVVNGDGLSRAVSDALQDGTHEGLQAARREVQNFGRELNHRQLPMVVSAKVDATKVQSFFTELSNRIANQLRGEVSQLVGGMIDANAFAQSISDHINEWVNGASNFAKFLNSSGFTQNNATEFMERFSQQQYERVAESLRDMDIKPIVVDEAEYKRATQILDIVQKITAEREKLAELLLQQKENAKNPFATYGTQTFVDTQAAIDESKAKLLELNNEAEQLGINLTDSVNAGKVAMEGLSLAAGKASNVLERLFPGSNQIITDTLNIADTFDKLDDSAVKTGEDIQKAVDQADKSLENVANNASEAGDNFGPWGAIAALIIDSVVQAVNNAQQSIERLIRYASKAAEAIIKITQNLIKMLRGMWNIAGSVTSAFMNLGKKVGAVFSKITSHSKKSNITLKKLFTGLTKYVLGFGSIFTLFNKMRKVVTEGFKSISKYSDRFNAAMTNMMSTWNQAKGQISAIFEPLITMIEPWLTQIIEKINQVALAITKFIGAITNVGKVLKATKVIKDYATAVNGASKQLAGFDELNNLSSGSGAGDNANGWEWVDAEIPDWIKRIQELWKTTQDFSEYGRLAAEKAVEFLDMFNSKINAVIKTMARAGKAAATFLNGLFTDAEGNLDSILFDTIGKTVANGVNAIAQFLISFVNNFKWAEFGQALGSGFVTMINGIDWANLSFLLVQGFKRILSTLSNFLNTISDKENGINVGAIRDSIQNTLIGLITDLKNFVLDTNWDNLTDMIIEFFSFDVEAIAQSLADLFDALKEKEVFKHFGEILLSLIGTAGGEGENTGLMGFINSLIQKTDINTAIDELVTFFTDLFTQVGDNLDVILMSIVERVDAEKVGQALNKLVASFINMFTLPEGEDGDKVQEWLGTLIDNIDIPGLVTSLFTVIRSIIDLIPWSELLAIVVPYVIALIQNIWNTVKPYVLSLLARLLSWLMNDVNQSLVNAGNNIGMELLRAFARGLLGLWYTLNPIAALVELVKYNFETMMTPTFQEKMRELKEKITEKWNEIKDKTKEKLGNIKQTISENASDMKTNMSEKFEAMKNVLSNKLELWRAVAIGKLALIKATFTLKFTEIKDKVIEIFNNLKNGIKTPINGILSGVELFINHLISGLNNMISRVNSLSFDLPDWVPLVGGESLGFTIPSLETVSIPRLAKGAVIPPNKEFMAVLGDQKRGTNIEAPLDTIVEAVKAAIGDNQSALITSLLEQQLRLLQIIAKKDLTIGDRAIYESVLRSTAQQVNMSGVNPLLDF